MRDGLHLIRRAGLAAGQKWNAQFSPGLAIVQRWSPMMNKIRHCARLARPPGLRHVVGRWKAEPAEMKRRRVASWRRSPPVFDLFFPRLYRTRDRRLTRLPEPDLPKRADSLFARAQWHLP